MRLSALKPIDLETTRLDSMVAARRDIDAGKRRPVDIAVYPGEERAILEDGRHRVLVGMRIGIKTWPVRLLTYGPRGGLTKSRASLTLDALP